MAVQRILLTGAQSEMYPVQVTTGFAVNWLEVRENRHDPERSTCLGTVYDDALPGVREVVEKHEGLTLEQIEGVEDTERYVLLVGGPGTGWGERES